MKPSPNLIKRLLELAIQVQRIPAPTFEESQRAAFVAEEFRREQLTDIEVDETGNVYARLQGQRPHPPLIVSAHLDTVFSFAHHQPAIRQGEIIFGPGIGDNAVGVAALFAIVWAYRDAGKSPTGDIWLIANVGEEGLGNLRGMRKVVERFGGNVLAYLVLEGMALGHIYNRALGVRRYRLSVQTKGGHSWVNHGSPSAIHHLARIICDLADIPLPETPRTSLNVGMISGGISVNTIAPLASAELDLRSESSDQLAWLNQTVLQVVDGANQPNVRVLAETTGFRPHGEIPSDHKLVRLAIQALKAQGIQPVLTIGSTDANIPLSCGYPAICIGLTRGSGAHTAGELIYTEPLRQGMSQLLTLTEKLFQSDSA
jgi:acetylornithine deacetylase/succinyl-diaminopimelate desuccinylase-like protein